MVDPPKPGANVIPLSSWRALLARTRRGRRLERFLAEPDAARLVPSLPMQELYYLIKETGLEEGGKLMGLVSSEQLRGFLDFELWDRDQLIADRFEPWLDALLDAGPDVLARHLRALDAEVVARWLQERVRVHDLTLADPPEEPEGHFYATPDRFFLLDVLDDGETGKRAERVIDWIYRASIDMGRAVLMAARWELGSDLEEWSYRWRAGRMADLGFIDYYEALEIYRWLDPASVVVGEGTADPAPGSALLLPGQLSESLDSAGFFGQVLTTIADTDELERVQGALLLLVNRVLSADRADPADLAAVPAALARVVDYLGLGLEFLGRGDPGRGAAAIASVALARIFRVGLSLTIKLQRAAATLVARGWVTAVPGQLSLLDEPDRSIVAALRQDRPVFPQYPLALEDPARNDSARTDPAPTGGRRFRALAEIAAAARALEEVATVGPLVRDGLGVDPRLLRPDARASDHPPLAEIRFSTIAATLAGNVLLDRPPSLVPLSPADLAPLRALALENGRLRPTARLQIRRALEARMAEREYAVPTTWEATLDHWLAHLERTLAPAAVGAPGLLPELVTGILLRTRTAASRTGAS